MKRFSIVLASNSPRRKELLAGLGIDFQVRVSKDIDESYPSDIPVTEIAEYISSKKAAAYISTIADNELIITADTIVVLDDNVLGKPSSSEEARGMLQQISGRTHQVITGVCVFTKDKKKSFSVCSDVTFKSLDIDEINYYIDNYKPFDKAGSYGIQEWIGYIGVTSLSGSYFNVMGFPIQRIYEVLKEFEAI